MIRKAIQRARSIIQGKGDPGGTDSTGQDYCGNCSMPVNACACKYPKK